MLNTDQKSDLLFKKSLGKGSSNSGEYYNEYLNARTHVDPRQMWISAESIPIPSLGFSTSLVEYIQDLTLIPIPGSTSSFYHANIRDSIPFNYDPNGSYVPTLKKSDNTVIVFGQNDWIFDTDAGQVTFYNGVPSGVSDVFPPKITCWRYAGPKGIVSPGVLIKDFISGQIESPSVDNYYYLVNNNPVDIKILGLSIALWQGSGKATVIVDSTPVTGLIDVPLNGTDTLYNAVAGGYDAPTGSVIILALSDMSVDAGRTRFTLNVSREMV